MATTQAPQDGAAGPATAARPDDLQSLKHHNQLLLANLNAGRKALAEARQNEQRILQLYEQVQAQLAEREQSAAAALAAFQAQLSEREQAAAATLAVFQAQLAEAGAREQQLLAMLQQERERAAASAPAAGEPVDGGEHDVQLLARIDALQQTLLDQLAQQAAPASPDPEVLEAARQREQALAVQVAQLQQALADRERELEATRQALEATQQREQAERAAQQQEQAQEVTQQREQAEAAAGQREQMLAAQVDQLQQALADKERALEAATVLQQMDEVVNKGRQIMAGLGPVQQHLESQGHTGEALQAMHGDLRQVMTQAVAKMDTLLQAVTAQAEKLEQLGKQTPPPAPAAGNRSRFAADDNIVLDLPSDLLARTGTGTAPGTQDAPLP